MFSFAIFFTGGNSKTGQRGQTVLGRIAKDQPTILAPAMESFFGFEDISSIYKLIIAPKGRGECKTKDNGKRWCYVDKGSCKDEKKGRSSGMFWSFEACRKGQTVRLRRKLVFFLNISRKNKSCRHGICPKFSPNFNSFSKKKQKKIVNMEKFTLLAKILHCRRQ